MNIYVTENTIVNILFSKPNNPHYLNRYIRFIESCRILNEDYTGYTEKHHICPQAKDLFPEYKSSRKHPWNLVALTPRQHFIAHRLLWKSYPEMKSMTYAFFLMSHTNDHKLDSRTYARLSEEYNKNHHFLGGETNRKRVDNKTHNFLGGDIQRESAKKRVDNKTHNFLGGDIQRESNRKRVNNKTHHFLGGEIARESAKKRVDNKTHNFLGEEINRKRVREGTHNFLGGEINRKRVADKTHHLLDSVSCYDKQGTFVRVPKEIYHNQTGPMEDWEYVHNSSKEAKRRRNI